MKHMQLASERCLPLATILRLSRGVLVVNFTYMKMLRMGDVNGVFCSSKWISPKQFPQISVSFLLYLAAIADFRNIPVINC